MTDARDDIKERFLAVLKNLTTEERKLFSLVLRAEDARLSEKSPNMKDELLKLVRQVIP
jgi:hypothetical protein